MEIEMTEVFLYIAAGLYVIVSVLVSVFLIKRDDLDAFQKTVQTILVWVIPVIGAVIFWRLNRSHDLESNRTKEFGGGGGSGGYGTTSDGGGGSD